MKTALIAWLATFAVFWACDAAAVHFPRALVRDRAAEPACLRLRGGAGRRKHKTVHLHDLARNDSRAQQSTQRT